MSKGTKDEKATEVIRCTPTAKANLTILAKQNLRSNPRQLEVLIENALKSIDLLADSKRALGTAKGAD